MGLTVLSTKGENGELMLMQTYSESYEIKYFLSAFLSAVSSCIEHNKLHSSDPRFKDWYRNIAETVVAQSVLPRLTALCQQSSENVVF